MFERVSSAGREVMAVPGHPCDPQFEGSNALLRDGAAVVRGADDVLDELRIEKPREAAPALHDEVLRGYLVQVHNLDEGRTIETTLAQADPELLSLTEAAPVGIAVTDPSGRFVYRNPAAQALLGPDVSSFGDLDWLDLARPAHRSALATAFDAALHDGVEHTTTRPVSAVCRCHKSASKPWCDGTHKVLPKKLRPS